MFGVFNPWQLFFSNPRVCNRINNYASASATLHVRFMINGNGFYYGRALAAYCPLHNFDSMSQTTIITQDDLVQMSQRMKVFIDPSDCCSQELELPFVWHQDAIFPNATGASAWNQLGVIHLRTINALKHANASVQPLTITVMAWATNVKLANPTSVNMTGLVVQAGDEYGEGPLEHTATAVAEAASVLARIPTIRPFARATEMMSGRVARYAAMFGMSRPAILAPLSGMRPQAVSALAPCDAGDNSAKLTVDSKQEITIDPGVIGIDLPDELNLQVIAAKESYLNTFSWATTNVSGNLLYNIDVHPGAIRINGTAYYLPACAFAIYPFKWWRGTMRYRFQVVSSAYHRGRLRIVWDPSYCAAIEPNVQFQKIVDISTEKDITVDINWGMNVHYGQCGIGVIDGTAARPAPSSVVSRNGVLAVHVLNPLATPNSVVNNDIFVNVYVSCVDLAVAQPFPPAVKLVNGYSAVVQAGEGDVVDDGNSPSCGPTDADHHITHNSDDPHTNLVYFGERIMSFRQLLRRYSWHSAYYVPGGTTTVSALEMYSLPEARGYENVARALHTTTAAGSYNYVSDHIMHWLMPAFVAWRGSLRSKYVLVGVNASSLLGVQIGPDPLVALPTRPLAVALLTATTTNASAFARTILPAFVDGPGASGAAITAQGVNPALEVEFPDYNPERFHHARNKAAELNPLTHRVTVAGSAAAQSLHKYVGVGEDFALHWFQGCPVLYTLGNPP